MPVVTRDEPLAADRLYQPEHLSPRRPSIARTLAEIPLLLLLAALIAFAVKSVLAQAFYIPSESMVPQLALNDRVVVSKLAYKSHEPRRGDILVFDDPRPGARGETQPQRTGAERLFRSVGEAIGVVQPSTDEFIKRVIGTPGETVEGKGGSVYVNGKLLFEPYLKPTVRTSDFPPVKIRKGMLWVMGDNRAFSQDSRFFGQVRRSTVVGRAVLKVWPPRSVSFL